jgi:hypothetical protein
VQRRTTKAVLRIHVSATLEQQIHDSGVATECSPMERRLTRLSPRVDVGPLLEQGFHLVDITIAGRIV